MIQQKLKGTGVAVVTPFNNRHKIDEQALKNILNYLIEGKVEYLVLLGTTGESVTLSKEEKKKLISLSRETIAGRVPVVVGLGGSNTAELVKELSALDSTGIDAILSVSPYYNKPTQAGIYHHYKALSEASPLPIILYNVPGRTASNLTADTTLKLAHDHRNIIAIKEASANFEQSMEIIAGRPKDFLVISGDDVLSLPLISMGMDGVISVIANALPLKFSNMVRAALAGELQTAKALHYEMLKVMQLIFTEGNPGGIKALMAEMQLCENQLRLPLYPVSENLAATLKSSLS